MMMAHMEEPPAKKPRIEAAVEREKVFNDSIHGHIVLHPLLVKIIDTPQFQRLRNIKQLGGCYYVYSGASHNRFEHSIGVAHLAGKLVEKLYAKQPELQLEIEDRDVLCVKIAGLCHDLGHGPFSHLWDKRFIPKVREGCQWKHEQGSVMMLDHLIEVNQLKEEFEKNGLTDTDIEFIKELIDGPQDKSVPPSDSWNYKGRPKEKSFLYEIVANKRNGVDVDKWDYFRRDCHHLGIACSFDPNRAMEFVRVIEADDGLKQICFRDKEVGTLYQMFQTRLSLHKMAYQHKTSNAVERMLTDALVLADLHIKLPGKNGELKKMSECIDDPYAYTNLTDHVLHQILASPDLEESRKLLVRIQKRDLYKYIGRVQSTTYDEKMIAEIAEFTSGEAKIEAADLDIDIVAFDFGRKGENPVDHIRFYTKNDPDSVMTHKKELVSQILPDKFREKFVRVYCKVSADDKVAEAKRCFNEWRKKKKMEETEGGSQSKIHYAGHPLDSDGMFPTPSSKSDSKGSKLTSHSGSKARRNISKDMS